MASTLSRLLFEFGVQFKCMAAAQRGGSKQQQLTCIKLKYSMKVIAIHIICSSHHRKCFLEGFVLSLFLSNHSLARASLIRDFDKTPFVALFMKIIKFSRL